MTYASLTPYQASPRALAAAALVLTLFALQAEYGIDPSGPGLCRAFRRKQRSSLRSDRQELVLAPHLGAEVKAHMGQGDHLIFRWQASGGQVRFDMHGEPPNAKEGEFSSYWKGKDLDSAQGAFTAPFTGAHGWYFRNRGRRR